jgi:fermentation-respiration switch protein FrsA (DUF1100 family)
MPGRRPPTPSTAEESRLLLRRPKRLAEHGFVTLAFDASYTGESGGEPRNVASPDINTEDFSAAVDFLGLQPTVDRERIGIIGICGWGGMALNAAAVDKRVKAVVASTTYDMKRVMSKGYNDSVTLEQRTQALEQMSRIHVFGVEM